ncbi:hypothetical protein P5G65_11085 [Paenibacillus chondroitinus]|uniref:Uncharacterized protein n=1 Tax=Paenibacillus chondroitinus TaxID=59842 RepID=A0ABU6D9P7_9BACL|nr:hypothetical protein [Paenibacillus chondroitinus]MEB4794443.1 hypothetical protein [Paenibacillus chondroitinus]
MKQKAAKLLATSGLAAVFLLRTWSRGTADRRPRRTAVTRNP